MDFIIENYIWIIIIAVFLIMALIGYLAEKTDFVHANKTKKKERKEKTKEVVDELTDDPSSEIPSVELEDPEADKKEDGDALLFDDPFAMNTTSNGMVEELPKEDIPSQPVDDYIDLEHTDFEVPENLNEAPVYETKAEDGIDPSLFAPVEKPKFGEEFVIPEDHLPEVENVELPESLEEVEELEIPESMDLNGPSEKVDTVEEISADEIFSQPTKETTNIEDATPTETVNPDLEGSIPEIKEENTSDVDVMDDWKF
ncbi:MAG: hypothetical protein KH135_03740 [Firmicutes bacterium]|nr:hypothetical protein [Bacillota bacterium]